VQVPVPVVRDWLRQAFQQWGMPGRLRMDNGWPWGSGGDLPTPLALWLWGLGCELVWNRPARPQQNGKVERYHGLLDTWGEPGDCADWAAWEQRLAWLVKLQREVYPAVDGKTSRLAAHPDLRTNPRVYGPEVEAAWSLARVYTHLGQGHWRRKVGRKGQITLYHRPQSVGTAYAGQQVYVGFDPAAGTWVIQDARGQEISRRPAPELGQAAILALDVSHVKAHESRKRQEREVPNLPAFVAI
jgi:hypothetical protein